MLTKNEPFKSSAYGSLEINLSVADALKSRETLAVFLKEMLHKDVAAKSKCFESLYFKQKTDENLRAFIDCLIANKFVDERETLKINVSYRASLNEFSWAAWADLKLISNPSLCAKIRFIVSNNVEKIWIGVENRLEDSSFCFLNGSGYAFYESKDLYSKKLDLTVLEQDLQDIHAF